MNPKNQKGTALILSLLVVTVLLIFAAIFIFRSVVEKATSDRERMATQALYIAEGGSEAALEQLDILINIDMLNTVNSTNPQKVANDAQNSVTSGDSVNFLLQYVKVGNTPELVLNGTQAEYPGTATALGNGTYQYKIILTEKSNPLTMGVDTWDFLYYFRIETTANVGSGVSRQVAKMGDFTVRVQRDNFAKYALFTNQHKMPNGTTVWFTNKTNFAGPVHTNERLSFALNPSGTFDGIVTQQYSTGRFYNSGFPILLNAASNPPKDVPTFNEGYTRSAALVELATATQKQDMINQARAGDTATGNGIFLANNGTSLTGGIYIKGNSTISMSVDSYDHEVYTITQGSTTKIITVDHNNVQTTVQAVGGPRTIYNGLPDGVDDVGTLIFANGMITSLGGKIQKDTELTIAGENDIVISNHISYSDYTPAVGTPGTPGYQPPTADGAKNLFGLVSWNGNVRIGTSSPNDINVHGSVMAQKGVFTVDNYSNTRLGRRGTATLLGGAITGYYGAFGQFNGSTGQHISGYGRNFVYDQRMLVGKAPPYFPTMKTFIAFTNDITDKIAWQEGGF